MKNLIILKHFDMLRDVPVYSWCSELLVPVKRITISSFVHGSDELCGQLDLTPATSDDLLKSRCM